MRRFVRHWTFWKGFPNRWKAPAAIRLGAAGGAAAGAGGYEWKINQELERIQEARQAGKMSEQEYQIRKDQIQRMSILK